MTARGSAFREYDPARDQNTSSGPVSLRAGDANRTVAITAVPRSPALAVGLAAWTNGFSDMTDLGKSVQLLLARHFHADRPYLRRQDSADGTIKWLIKLMITMLLKRFISGFRQRHFMYFITGRLHSDLLLLSYRNTASGAQSQRG